MNVYEATLSVPDGPYRVRFTATTFADAEKVVSEFTGTLVEITMVMRGVVPFDLSSGTCQS